MKELAHVNRFSTAGELTASIAHRLISPSRLLKKWLAAGIAM